MRNAFFIESSNKIRNSAAGTFNGHVWHRLQELRERVARKLLDEGPLCQNASDDIRVDAGLADDGQDIEWHHRSQLETRLRDITDAQDRLFQGNYGECIECGEQISSARLMADPVASLCLKCQSTRETESVFPTL